jgi:hypothetical protein
MHRPAQILVLTLVACGGGDKTSDSTGGSTTTPQTSTDASSGPGTGATVTSSGSSSAGSMSDSASDTTTTVTTGAPGTSTSTSTSTGPAPGTTTTGETTTDATTTKGEGSSGTTTSGASTGDVCADQMDSCAMGEKCCVGLECCSGNPVPPGKEFCSDQCPDSDRNLKTAIRPVDATDILRRVVSLDISTWQYKKDSPDVRHLGPMAQDFRQAFGLWDTDRMIFPLDASGVSLTAIQALHQRVVDAERENEDLRARLDRLEVELADVRRERR